MPAVRTAERTLTVFEAFESARGPLSLSELARATDLPISSCHGLVQTLLARGYLYSSGRRKEFYPTRRLLTLAQTLADHDPFLDRIAPLLHALRDRTKETVIVGKRQGDAVLYLDVIEGLHTIRYSARPGEYKPLHSSSIGKAMLGGLAPDALDAWLAEHRLKRITENTITDAARLRRDLAEGRRRGYFVTRGENVADVTALAISLTINHERLGIALAGPSQRMHAQEARMAARLLELKRQLEKEAA